jgi:hypothetical protein
VLRTVLDASPDCVINFESLIKFKENGLERAAEGIDWIRELLADYEEEKEKLLVSLALKNHCVY